MTLGRGVLDGRGGLHAAPPEHGERERAEDDADAGEGGLAHKDDEGRDEREYLERLEQQPKERGPEADDCVGARPEEV